MSDLLKGIRVLDFGRYIAGPYCAALLAEYGAEVIRIEKRSGSEDRYTAPVAPTGEGALFLQMNRNKRSLTLDPMAAEGREVVQRLVKTADVVIANLPERTLAPMGLDYESLCAVKPDIILTTVSAYGASGPMSGYVGFDGVGQAMSGAVYMSGEPGKPQRAWVAWVDFATALHCAFGTMIALMERSRSGKGQIVKGSLLGSALTLGNAMLIEQAVLGINRQPTGNRGQTAAPVDIFRTADGSILCQVVGQPLYERWARLMGEPEWLTDPRFKDDLSRGNHGEVVSERMARWCATRTTQEVIETLGKAAIPCGPVLSPQQALDHPQVAALGLLQPLDFPGLPKPAPVATPPIFFSRTERVPRKAAPVLGADTAKILGEIGYTEAEVAQLRERRVI
ncbi:MAG TPA: CoA transferase [Burkholderiales bacterium]|nr:CoA transferase [Burkholderiales bacterium]